MNCSACHAAVPCKADGAAFWKPVICLTADAEPSDVERRICEGCRRPFCIRRFRAQRFCSSACRGAATTAARIAKPFFSFETWRWYITPPGEHQAVPLARHMVQVDLERKLTSDEVVHHIDGNHMNDDIENLQVLTRAEHMAIHSAEITEALRQYRMSARLS